MEIVKIDTVDDVTTDTAPRKYRTAMLFGTLLGIGVGAALVANKMNDDTETTED